MGNSNSHAMEGGQINYVYMYSQPLPSFKACNIYDLWYSDVYDSELVSCPTRGVHMSTTTHSHTHTHTLTHTHTHTHTHIHTLAHIVTAYTHTHTHTHTHTCTHSDCIYTHTHTHTHTHTLAHIVTAYTHTHTHTPCTHTNTHNSYMNIIGVHELHGRMFAHDPLSSPGPVPLSHPVAGN